jgi:hypothetical protein
VEEKMKIYKNVDDFIIEIFPLEYRKIIKQKNTPVEDSIENANRDFAGKLEGIIKGEKEKENK